MFVFMGNTAFDVAVGEVVSVAGTVSEFGGLTQIGGAVQVTALGGSSPDVGTP